MFYLLPISLAKPRPVIKKGKVARETSPELLNNRIYISMSIQTGMLESALNSEKF